MTMLRARGVPVLLRVLLGGVVVWLAGCGNTTTSGTINPPPGPTPEPNPPSSVTLSPVAGGFSSPTDLQALPDGRLLVLEQAGRIRIVQNGQTLATPFLDIASRVTSGGETGLLGLAFHPNYSNNGQFYLNYTRTLGGQLQTVIAEYRRSATDANRADAGSERVLLTVNQPFSNHNGGQLQFGPEGLLYIGLGDGGSAGDPLGNAQNKQTLLGKLLRIDVNGADAGKQYRVPADNPFGAGGGLPEIWAYGLRNPWRFSFDSASGQLFLADVGQSAREEIDLIERGGNYGWNTMEGSQCFNPGSGCNQAGLILPIHDYGRGDGGTVTGGYVYRGPAIPGLVGSYVFGDFLSGRIWSLRATAAGTWTRTTLAATGRPISSFGRDAAGELYVVDYNGSVLKIVP